MALVKQPISINFNNGIETKTDPFQVPVGKFLTLVNSVFNTQGRLTKRNGFPIITTLPNENQTTLTTLNDNLLATGSNLFAFSQETNEWLDQGVVQPVDLDTKALIRSSLNQTEVDAATTEDGLSCIVYTENTLWYYTIIDSNTGQQVVAPIEISGAVGSVRAFLLGRYFIITFIASVGPATHLQYFSIPIASPESPSSYGSISTSLVDYAAGYDGCVANNALYLAWGDTGPSVLVTYISSTLIVQAPAVFTSTYADYVSVTADNTTATPTIWVSYTDSGDGYALAVDHILGTVLAPTLLFSGASVAKITSTAQNQLCTIYYEIFSEYTDYGGDYPVSGVRADFIKTVNITDAGVVSTPEDFKLNVGLASKAWLVGTQTYMLLVYGASNQPSYFLSDGDGNIVMRLAYSNGGGYIPNQVIPNVSINNDVYSIPYLFKDFLASTNKSTNIQDGAPTSAIYTQTGVNLASFSINATGQYSSEIASTLHLTGGQLWMYDSIRPVEHGFHLWPEDVQVEGHGSASGEIEPGTYKYVVTYEWTDNKGNLHRSAPSIPATIEILTPPANFTANRTSGSAILTGVSSFTNLQVGQHITGTGIAPGTYIDELDEGGGTLTMTLAATSGTSTSTTITPTAAKAVRIYVPTLTLTYKVSPNPVRIVGYRWSANQQTYYQFTSITTPDLNDTTAPYIVINDDDSDAEILGNTLLYTTGGVVENIAAPANKGSALFKNRLFLIDAENPNTLWYSKQVIQNTPVEMSDLLTLYVAPTSGAQGSTGDISAISAMDDKLIIFKPDAIYYLTGTGPDNTGSNNDFTDPIFITSSVGCDNPSSIVLMPAGLMFQSGKGIWLLGRDLSTQYIGSPVEAYNSFLVKSAQSIPGTNQVRFILDDNTTTLMYDYYYQQWGTFSNIRAISATLYQGMHTYLSDTGRIYQEEEGTYRDGSQPVLMSFKTAWFNIAGLQGYERFYQMYLLGKYLTPYKLNVSMAYDYGNVSQSVLVTPDNYSPNWGGDANWGAGEFWGGPGNVFEARVFPEKQKCESFQVSVQEAYDASMGVAAGAGLTLSGLNLLIGVKKGARVQRASKSFG